MLQAPQRAATTAFTRLRTVGVITREQGVIPREHAAFTRLRTYCGGGFSLLRASLVEGGRQHQIRRHLNSVAHQVVGDRQHGKSRINALLEEQFGLPRMFLHAERLQMLHPATGAEVDVRDPLPQDLRDFLARLPP